MKNKLTLLLVAGLVLGAGNAGAQFVDLSTGQQVTIVKHNGTGMMYNTQTQRPVYIYVNTATRDTFYGRTGAIINGRVTKTADGKFFFDDGDYIFDDGEYRLRRESDSTGYKRKTDNDGSQKVKYGDYKRKTDSNGDLKLKEGDAKVKDYSDGREKVKVGDYKKKIDGEGNYREGDDSLKIKAKTDGSVKVKDKRENYKGKIDDDDKDFKEKTAGEKRKYKKDKVKQKKTDNNEANKE